MATCTVCRPGGGAGPKYFRKLVYVVGYTAANNRLTFNIVGDGPREYAVRWANLRDMCYLPSFGATATPPVARTTGELWVNEEWAAAQSPALDTRGDPKHPAGAGGSLRTRRLVEIGPSYFLVRVEDESRRFDGRAYWIQADHLDLTNEARFGLRSVLTPVLFTAPNPSAIFAYDGEPVPSETITEAEFDELQGAPVMMLEHAQDTTIVIPSAFQGDAEQRRRAFIDFSIPSKSDPKRQPFFDEQTNAWSPAFIDDQYFESLPNEVPPISGMD